MSGRSSKTPLASPSLCACVLACAALSGAAAEARQKSPGGGTTRRTPAQVAPVTEAPRSPRSPLTMSYLLDSLRKREPPAKEVLRLVRERGVDFRADGVDASQLRGAGATDELLEAVRANYHPAQPEPSAIADAPASPGGREVPYMSPVTPRQESGGPGTGPGFGRGVPGGEVYYSRPFKASEVTKKAAVTFSPEPEFTDEARRNKVKGRVMLRVVFTAYGAVTNIRVVKGLPDGLTERAMAAAKQIRFTPAQKDGRAVSQYVTLDYNFR